MAESTQDSQTKKSDSDKKPPETVLLTVEELKAISGGLNPGGTMPKPKTMTPPPGTQTG